MAKIKFEVKSHIVRKGTKSKEEVKEKKQDKAGE